MFNNSTDPVFEKPLDAESDQRLVRSPKSPNLSKLYRTDILKIDDNFSLDSEVFNDLQQVTDANDFDKSFVSPDHSAATPDSSISQSPEPEIQDKNYLLINEDLANENEKLNFRKNRRASDSSSFLSSFPSKKRTDNNNLANENDEPNFRKNRRASDSSNFLSSFSFRKHAKITGDKSSTDISAIESITDKKISPIKSIKKFFSKSSDDLIKIENNILDFHNQSDLITEKDLSNETTLTSSSEQKKSPILERIKREDNLNKVENYSKDLIKHKKLNEYTEFRIPQSSERS